MLGHELRNPLAPIVTRARPHAPARRRRRRASARSSSARSSTCAARRRPARRLAHHARQDRAAQRERVELRDVVDAALELAQPARRAAQARLEVDVPERRLRVDGDPARLAQVVRNLLTNAAKFTPPRRQHRGRARARDGDRRRAAVRDNGRGIARELLPHVFEPFVQGAQARARRAAASGSGLAIVQGLVELHGGTVAARERRRRHAAAAFVVRLPLRDRGTAQRVVAPRDRRGRRRALAARARRRRQRRCGRARSAISCAASATSRSSRTTARARSRVADRVQPESRSSTSGCRAWMATSSHAAARTPGPRRGPGGRVDGLWPGLRSRPHEGGRVRRAPRQADRSTAIREMVRSLRLEVAEDREPVVGR